MEINRKLNFAMLGHKRIPSREGGIEIVVEELATRMVNLGHEVTCYNRGGHHVSGEKFDSVKINTYKGIKLKTVFTLNKKGLAAMTSSAFASIVATFGKYDVIHYHAEGSCAMMWFPKLFRKRCVVTVHGLDWQRAKWKNGFASKYIKFGEKMAVRFADEIIVLSVAVQSYFKDTYGRETHFVPNGVSKPDIKVASLIKEKYGLEKDSYILFLGRIVPEKGLRYLIEAYKQLNTDKKLVIAGGASDTDEFVSEIKDMATDNENIIITGFIEGQMLDELYSNAYIYTLPSDLEGMPLSLLEAMSYGNCCVVSDIAECAEVVEDKAVLFKKSDVTELKEKLQELCDSPERVYAYKTVAAQYVCEKYSWDDVVEQTLKVYYNSMLDRKPTYLTNDMLKVHDHEV